MYTKVTPVLRLSYGSKQSTIKSLPPVCEINTYSLPYVVFLSTEEGNKRKDSFNFRVLLKIKEGSKHDAS